MSRHAQALAVIDEDPDEAYKIALDILRDSPDDQAALFITGIVNSRAERYGVTIPIFERITKLNPRHHQAWNNLGMSYQECNFPVKARECFKKALEYAQTPNYLSNLSASYLTDGNYQESIKWAKKSLEKEDNDQAWTTLGFAHLATGNWKDGWAGYEKCLGGRFRKIVQLGDEQKWDGKYVDRLFIYGEQGLGDEIMYASIFEDAIQHAGQVTVECDKRLKGLFQRSFPTIEVRGTRRESKFWYREPFTAGCAAGSLAYLFRPDRSTCPRKPYLVADPERRLQWSTLFKSWGKPVIGIAWTGGRAATCRRERLVGLESFRPLIESIDAVFVSLQYTDATDEIAASGLPVKHIHRAVQSPDYDDTAAFVAELDGIVGIHTTIHHLAGALGKPSTILVPEKPMWNYATGDGLPWYRDQKFHRQKHHETWVDCIKRIELDPSLPRIRS